MLLPDRSKLFKSHWSNQWLTVLHSYRLKEKLKAGQNSYATEVMEVAATS